MSPPSNTPPHPSPRPLQHPFPHPLSSTPLLPHECISLLRELILFTSTSLPFSCVVSGVSVLFKVLLLFKDVSFHQKLHIWSHEDIKGTLTAYAPLVCVLFVCSGSVACSMEYQRRRDAKNVLLMGAFWYFSSHVELYKMTVRPKYLLISSHKVNVNLSFQIVWL